MAVGEAHLGGPALWSGDGNGDGETDLLVGAPQPLDWQVLEGSVFLFFSTLLADLTQLRKMTRGIDSMLPNYLFPVFLV